MARSKLVSASEAIELQPPAAFTSAADYFPARRSLPSLRKAADGCKACDLWRTGTQTVFGEGKRSAEIMFVGEQPGNEEDLEDRPFVGPSGRLLDEALQAAGIDRSAVYITNAVKHFKWEGAGNRLVRGIPSKSTAPERRLHAKPSRAEQRTCRPWLSAEVRVVRPRLLVCLGATAAQAVLGPRFRVTQDRGKSVQPSQDFIDELEGIEPFTVIATVHPSSVLRAPSAADRERARKAFFKDIATAARHVRKPRTSVRRGESGY
jgi:uracil-DNA glycosylase